MSNALTTSTSTGALNIFFDERAYNQAWKVACAFADSSLVPATYRGKPQSCLIALDLAQRLECHPLAIMQNTYEVGGRPGFSTAFLVALATARGVIEGEIDYEVAGKAQDGTLAVTAYAKLARSGEVRRATVTLAEARAEGWTKNPKYQSIPEQMLRKRAASRFIDLYAPGVKHGFPTIDEVRDEIELVADESGSYAPASAEAPRRPEPKPEPKAEEAEVSETEKPSKAAKPAAKAEASAEPAPAPEPARETTSEPAGESAPASSAAPAEEPEDRYEVISAAGEVVGDYAKARVPAQKALQAELEKCSTIEEVETCLENNEALMRDFPAGCKGNVENTAQAMRDKLAPAPEPETTPEPAPAPAANAAPETAPEAPAADPSLKVEVPKKGDGSTDFATLFARLRKAVESSTDVDAWKAANVETLEELRKNVPSWAKALSDLMAKRREALGS